MKSARMRTLSVVAALAGSLLAVLAAPELVDREVRQLSAEQIEKLKTVKPVTGKRNLDGIDPNLLRAEGSQQIIVHLRSPSVAMANCASQTERMSHKRMLRSEQSNFMNRIQASISSVKHLACVHTLLNAVFLEIDAKDVAKLAADSEVVSIRRVKNYDRHLSETVPYIGASTVQNDYGVDGTGVTVAVLDSGIDYTHAAMGGEGTIDAYNAAYDDFTSRDDLFPTAKVIDGYDFVGEVWPNGELLPDDDPIDFSGHGTSVADILAGQNGVAPGASLVAVKVCSATADPCSGIALVLGMDFAVDPNGDGDTSDAVDVINMSLGFSYGQPFDDTLSQAVEAATLLGVLTVAAAGNSGDKPYVVSTPSSALSALSVAETQMPSASLSFLTVADGSYPAIFQPWSKPLNNDEVVTGIIQYGDGDGGNLDGCGNFTSGSLSGKFVLVDRGTCNFTLKMSKVTLGGGVVGIIGLNDSGLPFASSDGGDRPIEIPAYMISQDNSTAMKAVVGSLGTIDPNNQLPLVMQMVSTSSRGPQHQETTVIKPEIGAPGGSVSAQVGTGTGTAHFSGTSGATPMVAGSAALLLQAFPLLTPIEVKARLMNNGNYEIATSYDEGLAPITRIGGGELRVDRAFTAPAAAWDQDTLQAALSFGFIDIDKETHTLHKIVKVRNYSDEDITYTITPTFRYEDDGSSGAVMISTNSSGTVQVGAGQDTSFFIEMTIMGALLPDNFMNSGSMGADPSSLTMAEFDGYLVLDDGTHPIHLPWHVLPRKAANVAGGEELDFSSSNPVMIDLENTGVGIAQMDSYSLLALSPDIPEGGPGEAAPTPDIKAVGVSTTEVAAGVCSQDSPSFIWAFAVSTWRRQQHLIPVRFQLELDTNQDGTIDYVILNGDFSGNATPSDGRQITLVWNLQNQTVDDVQGQFFTEHSMNTGNTVLVICAEQIGMTAADLLKTGVDVSIYVVDILFDGPGDSVEGLTVTPGGERFFATTKDLGPNQNGSITVSDRGAFDGNSDELGLMIITNGDRGSGKSGGATNDTELKLLLIKTGTIAVPESPISTPTAAPAPTESPTSGTDSGPISTPTAAPAPTESPTSGTDSVPSFALFLSTFAFLLLLLN